MLALLELLLVHDAAIIEASSPLTKKGQANSVRLQKTNQKSFYASAKARDDDESILHASTLENVELTRAWYLHASFSLSLSLVFSFTYLRIKGKRRVLCSRFVPYGSALGYTREYMKACTRTGTLEHVACTMRRTVFGARCLSRSDGKSMETGCAILYVFILPSPFLSLSRISFFSLHVWV